MSSKIHNVQINRCKIEIDVQFAEYICMNYQHCAASDDMLFSHVSYHISRIKQILKLIADKKIIDNPCQHFIFKNTLKNFRSVFLGAK